MHYNYRFFRISLSFLLFSIILAEDSSSLAFFSFFFFCTLLNPFSFFFSPFSFPLLCVCGCAFTVKSTGCFFFCVFIVKKWKEGKHSLAH